MSVTSLKPANPAAPAARAVLEPPKDWGMSDEELASAPLAYRADLLANQVWLVSGGGSVAQGEQTQETIDNAALAAVSLAGCGP